MFAHKLERHRPVVQSTFSSAQRSFTSMLSTMSNTYSHQYQRIAGAQSPELEKDEVDSERSRSRRVGCRSGQLPLLTALIMLAVGTVLAFLLGLVVSSRASATRWCTQRISQPSPVTKNLDIQYSVQRFNGSLLKENVYRQAAGPEVDAAWAALGVNCESF